MHAIPRLGVPNYLTLTGFIGKLLLSHDVCTNSHYVMNGGFGYNFITSRLYPYLQEIGLSKEQFHKIMVENPRNALTGGN